MLAVRRVEALLGSISHSPPFKITLIFSLSLKTTSLIVDSEAQVGVEDQVVQEVAVVSPDLAAALVQMRLSVWAFVHSMVVMEVREETAGMAVEAQEERAVLALISMYTTPMGRRETTPLRT